jgi:ABC-2 type transport system ATP-binding protein
MPIVRADNLKKSFGGKPALSGVDMTVNKGDIYGFLGPNGSGKTTTLRIFLGVLKPDEGKVTILGMNPTQNGIQLRHRINALPESHGLYGWMTAVKYLQFFGNLYGMIFNIEDYRIKLMQVGLDPDDYRPIKTYSRGMKQRLGIARAIINNPEVVFLDEPTNGLDPRGRREIHDLLLKLNREEGLTIIISTHILDDVERLCNRIAIIDKGRVRYEGEPVYESRSSVRYRFHIENGDRKLTHWQFHNIKLLEQNDDWIICLIKEISPAEAIKKLVLSGLPVTEAVMVSGGLEDLYIQHTSGGAQ